MYAETDYFGHYFPKPAWNWKKKLDRCVSLQQPDLKSATANSIAMLTQVDDFICYEIVLNIYEQQDNDVI